MTRQDCIVELEKIADKKRAAGRDQDYRYNCIVTNWTKYGCDRTYLKLIETKDYSSHYHMWDYGYYDAMEERYVPGRHGTLIS